MPYVARSFLKLRKQGTLIALLRVSPFRKIIALLIIHNLEEDILLLVEEPHVMCYICVAIVQRQLQVPIHTCSCMIVRYNSRNETMHHKHSSL